MLESKQKSRKPKLVQNRKNPKVTKLSEHDWQRWDPEDAVKKFSEKLPELSDVVLIGRKKDNGTLVIYVSNMSYEYAHMLSTKAAQTILDEAV